VKILTLPQKEHKDLRSVVFGGVVGSALATFSAWLFFQFPPVMLLLIFSSGVLAVIGLVILGKRR